MKVKSESEVAQSCPTLSNPMDCSLPGSSVHGFYRQEYWSGVPLPSPKMVATCIINVHHQSVVIFFLWWELYSLSNTQMCNTVLLTKNTMVYIISQNLFILQMEICTFWPSPPLTPSLWQPLICPLFLWDSTYKWDYTIFVFLWFLLAWCPSSPSMSQMTRCSLYSPIHYSIVYI